MPTAIAATASKLARSIYARLATGSRFVDPGQDADERASTTRVVRSLSRRANDLGDALVKHDSPQALPTFG